MITYNRRPAWVSEIIQDGSLRESKRPRTYSSYVALLSDIIDAKPFSYEEAVEKKERKDAMLKNISQLRRMMFGM